ncbi:hypothetical protein JOF56_005243 [Kibdelosporangium banguiense]|uniref:Uncharacterized protein n=1 Tax=Kibdelosporangium banguiense TaxID=1365924 RepID=A0ABS4TKA8_9PSEU|nr:hypothetical protein [Kibdelosporangium banguiense]MBP2324858.1 hypothetical protein [Kibdelosporangium banguiense]
MRWNELGPVIAAVATVTALVGGYVQFVLRRAIYPCIEFDVDFILLRMDAVRKVGDIVLTVRNVGPGVGHVVNVQGRVRYSADDGAGVSRDGIEPAFGHLVQPQASPGPAFQPILGNGAFLFAPNWPRAFIQPGVTQMYRKPLAIPGEAVLIHVWGAFEYHIPVGPFSRLLARVFIHHAKTPKRLNYTVRRTFAVDQAP